MFSYYASYLFVVKIFRYRNILLENQNKNNSKQNNEVLSRTKHEH